MTRLSPLPVLADQSLSGPASALELATQHSADGLSVKLATCGGLRCARQIDAIARVARLATMVSCFIEPALLIAAGLSFAEMARLLKRKESAVKMSLYRLLERLERQLEAKDD